MIKTKLSKVKNGDYFRFAGRKKVYIKDGGGIKRGIRYHKDDDINSDYSTKTDKDVEIDFEY